MSHSLTDEEPSMAEQQPPIPPNDNQTPGVTGSPRRPMNAGIENEGFLSEIFQTRYREVTVSAIIFAILIGIVMNAAITYAGLKIGFTIGGSAIAAVLGFGVLRGILRKGSILETNIAQTIASAVNTSNSGVIFTVPVLFLLGYQITMGDRDFWTITVACVAGALLGTVFIIPLRKQMLDIERLRFPSPTGVATILKSPGAGPAKAVVLLAGCVLGAIIYLPAGLPSLQFPVAFPDMPGLTERLDRLVERDRLTPQQRQHTLMIAEWIESQDPPAAAIELGERVEERRELRERVEEARDARAENLSELRHELRAMNEQLDAAFAAETWNEELARRAYLASIGAKDWSELRHRRTGWATRPFFGYQDIPWRYPAEIDEEATAHVQAEEPNADPVLTLRADRNRDGKPDKRFADSSIDIGRWLGLPAEFPLIFAIAPFALGAGYITGKAGLFVLAGGILAYFFITPIAFNSGWIPAGVQAHEAAGYSLANFTRPLGIGLLLGGAMMGVLFSLPAIREALKSIAAASKLKASSDELGLKTIGVAVVLGLIVLFIAADIAGNTPINPESCPVTNEPVDRQVETAEYRGYTIGFATEDAAEMWKDEWTDEQRDAFMEAQFARAGWLAKLNPHVRAAIIAIIGAIWIWFAGIIISQCAGMTDWSPISGMSLLTIVLVLMLAGSGAVLGAVLLGAALCVAITLAADMMGDMKTGYLVGSKPKRQQFIELCVVWMGPIIAMFVLFIIVEANRLQFGVPIGPGTEMPAPQAMALQAVITGVQGGEMPYALYGFGALLGGLLGLGAFSGLGVLIGISMFLPFMFIATYGVGCLINMAVKRIKGRAWAEAWGVPFAAGLIVGEALLSLTINLIVLYVES
jgi:uncharacterized oligopeptide transporter (OPT) family protein